MDQPEHDAGSLALEEQFGIPSLELDFGEEGRLVLALDGRAATRSLHTMSASLDRAARRMRQLAPSRPSTSEAANMTQDEVDDLVARIEEEGDV